MIFQQPAWFYSKDEATQLLNTNKFCGCEKIHSHAYILDYAKSIPFRASTHQSI